MQPIATIYHQKEVSSKMMNTLKKFVTGQKNNNNKNLINFPLFSSKIRDYIENSENHKPFIIYGSSGTGKSALMAHIVDKVSENEKF